MVRVMVSTKLARRGLYTAVTAVAALAVLASGPASLAASNAPARPAAVSLTTKALFAEVHRAYLHVPAVEMTVVPSKSTLGFPRKFVFILRSGRVVGEEFT